VDSWRRFFHPKPFDLSVTALPTGCARSGRVFAAIACLIAMLALKIGLVVIAAAAFFWLDQSGVKRQPTIQKVCALLTVVGGSFILWTNPVRSSFFLAGLGCALLGCALGCLTSRRFVPLAQGLALVIATVCVANATGHLYGVSSPDGVLFAALALLLLSMAVLLFRAGSGLMKPLSSPAQGGLMARRLLPAALLLPPLLGWIRWQGERHGFYGEAFGMALFTTANVVTFTFIIWSGAALLNRVDLKREQTEHALLEAAPDGMLIVNSQGKIVLVSARTEALFGFNREELLGKAVETLMPAWFRVGAEPNRNEPGVGIGARGLRKDGGEFPVEIRLSPILIGAEALTVATVRDATTHKQAKEENALRASIVTFCQDAIISQTLDGFITSWNNGAEHLFGYSQTDAVGRQMSIIVPPYRVEEADYILQQLRKGSAVDFSETIRLRKDGHPVHLSLAASPVRDARGRAIGASTILRDISRSKLAEANFRLVVESAPHGIVIMNREGLITLVNAQTEKLFGYTREDLLGEPAELLLPKRFRSAGDALSPHAPPPGELCGLRKDGSEFAIEIGFNSIQTEDGLMLLSAITDVTERRENVEKMRHFNELLELQVSARTAELKAANRDLEDFAFAASHDLKAPLRVIENASRWLEEDLQPYLNQETRESMTMLRGRVWRMEKLLDDLLEYGRIGRASDDRFTHPISGDALIDNILAMLPTEGFSVNVSPKFAATQVTKMPLQQIFMNLIGNAIKHHDKGAGHIDVTVEDAGDHYAFAVKDDGPGIPARFHSQIFKVFQTLKPRDQVEGSGMGLALVRKNVETFGGTLSLESSEGNGSTFAFTWPKGQIQSESTRETAQMETASIEHEIAR
jgi:PAS domain S-box-containing protein